MNEEEIKQYYERIEKLLNGANKETYGFVPEEIRQILEWYEYLQQENEQLKEEIKRQDNLNKQLVEECQDFDKRIDKAIEYIMTELITEWAIKNDGYVSGSDLPADAITPLLDILKGEDNEI